MTGGQIESVTPDSLADRWVAAWTTGEFAPICTADVHYEDPATREPLTGLDALAGHSRFVHDAFPDLRIVRTGPRLGDESYACVPWRAAGTHRGQLPSLPALPRSDRFVTLHGVHFVELVDGRIRRARGFFDLYEAAIQLGLLPSRGSLSESALLLLRGFGLRR